MAEYPSFRDVEHMLAPPVCKEVGCSEPKFKPFHRCLFHYEAAQAPDKRAEFAAARRKRWDGTRERGSDTCAGCGAQRVPGWYRTGSRCKSCAVLDRRQRNWGLSADDQMLLNRFSGSTCYVCGRKQHFKSLAVDHLHGHCEKGCRDCIRGLLCQDDNHTIIGTSFEDPSRLLAAVIYLLEEPAQAILGNRTKPTDSELQDSLVALFHKVRLENGRE